MKTFKSLILILTCAVLIGGLFLYAASAKPPPDGPDGPKAAAQWSDQLPSAR